MPKSYGSVFYLKKNGSVPLERRHTLIKVVSKHSGPVEGKNSWAIYFKLIVVSKSTVETLGDTLLFALRCLSGAGDFFFFSSTRTSTLFV